MAASGKMNWETLLSDERLGNESKSKWKPSKTADPRSEFQRDFDRIAFSSSFRRLQDKAQVVPLAESDYPRTRLTHSIEVSIVGRSLGILVGDIILKEKENELLNKKFHRSDVGAIVSAACLAHDIGNPPFGHSGEKAMQHWFLHSDIGSKVLKKLNKYQKTDFTKFEGNAQGLRVLTLLQCPNRGGGLQLTYATLGAYTKYPTPSFFANKKDKAKNKNKHGFSVDDQETFKKIAKKLGLLKEKSKPIWCRHPLAFLVEAADDICYTIVDMEDAFLLENIPFEEIEKRLNSICKGVKRNTKYRALKEAKKNSPDSRRRKDIEQELVEYLRAKAIDELINQTVECFKQKMEYILKGEFHGELLKHIKLWPVLEEIKNFSTEYIYKTKETLKVETPGFQVVGDLLGLFVPAVINVNEKPIKDSTKEPKSENVLDFMVCFLGMNKVLLKSSKIDPTKKEAQEQVYEKLLHILDFISGSTDSYIVSIYREITGMALKRS